MITTTTPAVSPLAKILGRQPAKPSVDVPESRACLGGSSSNSGSLPQASGDGGPRAGVAVAVAVRAGFSRCSKCAGRVVWIDAYRFPRCTWCSPPLAASQVREVWADIAEGDPAPDPNDLWEEPVAGGPVGLVEPLWVRLDPPKDVTGGLGAVVGVGAKWDGVWWCEVVGEVSEGGDTGEVTHRNVHHRLGAIEEFLHDRPT